MGPWVFRLLRQYWVRLTKVDRSGRYFGNPFKVYHGVTQEEPLSPTIFNVVVDVVLQHWFILVALTEDSVDPGTEETESCSHYIQCLVAYFYTDVGLLALTWVERLQQDFTTLIDLFDCMGLRTNVAKTMSAVGET